MFRRWFASTLAVGMFLIAAGRAASSRWNLPPSERLHYTVRWFGVGVVDAVFDLLEPERQGGVTTQTIAVVAQTRALPSRIYRVTNRYETRVDAATGTPLTYRTEINEAKFQERLHATYDAARRTARYRLSSPPKTWEQTTPGATHTLFSALYAVRGHDFNARPKMTFVVDAKGSYWETVAERVRTRTEKGTLFWDVEVRFKRLSDAVYPRQSDLLTDNLVDESSPLKLRIRQSPPLVTRMEYGAKGLRVAAVLDGF